MALAAPFKKRKHQQQQHPGQNPQLLPEQQVVKDEARQRDGAVDVGAGHDAEVVHGADVVLRVKHRGAALAHIGRARVAARAGGAVERDRARRRRAAPRRSRSAPRTRR